jgi:GNAT superfamily N-acetyltransferase
MAQMKLIPHRLASDGHPHLIEQVRVLYNSTLFFLATHPISPQSKEGQQAWWKDLDHSRVVVHLYSPVESPWDIVAFSMVTDRGLYFTPMFAISNNYWGKGYGQEIIEHYLALAAGKPLRGEQLVSNGAICHLNARYGWNIVGERDGTQFLIHPNNVDRQQEVYDEMVRYWEVGS